MSLAATFAGLMLTGHRWVIEMLSLNLETGTPGEPSACVWDEVLDVLRPTPEQVRFCGMGPPCG
jgi:hypothetical protein